MNILKKNIESDVLNTTLLNDDFLKFNLNLNTSSFDVLPMIVSTE